MGVVGLALCEDHAHQVGPEIITDEGWEAIKRVVSAFSRMPPDRGSLEVFARDGLPHRGDFEPSRLAP